MRSRLVAEAARLVTLVGPPGVGKTRLSLAVAESVLDQFTDGVFFVRLGPVVDPALVASTIAHACGLRSAAPTHPLSGSAPTWRRSTCCWCLTISSRSSLPPLVDDLLRRCRWLHVLVTSRQPLRVRAERQIIVHPLALPAAAPDATPSAPSISSNILLWRSSPSVPKPSCPTSPSTTATPRPWPALSPAGRPAPGHRAVAARVKLLPPAGLLSRLHGPWLLSVNGLRDVSARQRLLRGDRLELRPAHPARAGPVQLYPCLPAGSRWKPQSCCAETRSLHPPIHPCAVSGARRHRLTPGEEPAGSGEELE
ncbi:MAG: hypothetical protein HZY76_00680 [Anaerolineae bacterium]|nr:MAG: hypothetical protein HZY76_00680 [Anaerolineae bacterium]